MKATGTFTVSKWEENGMGGAPGRDLFTRVSAVFDATGDIQGQLSVEYVMHSSRRSPSDPHDADVTYVGYLAFDGCLMGRAGGFILEDRGAYSAAGPASAFTIKPQSGTGGLEGIEGRGRYCQRGGEMALTIEYTL